MVAVSSTRSARPGTLALVLGLLACAGVGRGSDAAQPDAASLIPRRDLSASPDLASLLQRPDIFHAGEPKAAGAAARGPQLIPLRRESVPVYRKGKVASFKTSYSGILSVGTPAQEFRVVFDTGSGHIVLPAAECHSEACLIHRRFNMTESSSAVPINTNGRRVPEGELADQVTIGFGTGEITGEFARDTVCFNRPSTDIAASEVAAKGEPSELEGVGAGPEADAARDDLCIEMSVILAVEMSTQPFKTFHFDGILGLGLAGLAMSKKFSAYHMLMDSGRVARSHFGVFLTEGEDGEESEIAMGGFNEDRLLDELKWAPVAMADLGYWQIRILAVRINGVELDVCKDGACRGVVDTGTSHLGIPAPYDAEFADLLTRDAGDLLDCRNVDAPEIEIELAERNLTLHPQNYMRRLPLREGVSVSSAQGVYVPSKETNETLGQPSSADPVPGAAVGAPQASAEAVAPEAAAPGAEVPEPAEEGVRRFCRPRLMPVRLPQPLGPKLFILGEPVLHRYYTVFDWGSQRVGFSLANSRRNTADPAELRGSKGELPKEVDMLLMQTARGVRQGGGSRRGLAVESGGGEEIQEETILVQVHVRISRVARAASPREPCSAAGRAIA